MSKADEMLYKKNYTKRIIIQDKEEILKQRYLNGNSEEISFDTVNKVINITTMAGQIDMQELQAINEKVKELGWNDKTNS